MSTNLFDSSDCGEDGFCSEEGICEWPQSECPAEAPHPCYNENNELVSCEMDEFACHGDGSHHSGPRDCSFNEATCDAQNGESCYPLVDEQGARAFCLTPCDPEATECGDGLQCRRGDGDPADTFYCLPESDPNDWLERCDVDSPSVGKDKSAPNKSRVLQPVLRRAPVSSFVHMAVAARLRAIAWTRLRYSVLRLTLNAQMEKAILSVLPEMNVRMSLRTALMMRPPALKVRHALNVMLSVSQHATQIAIAMPDLSVKTMVDAIQSLRRHLIPQLAQMMRHAAVVKSVTASQNV